MAQPTLDDIRAWPAAVSIPKACTAYGIGRTHGYELARRGEFPAKVIRAGGRFVVVTATILRQLSDSDTLAA
jgi:predicted DNA-binding transcriptional regulator AlpA